MTNNNEFRRQLSFINLSFPRGQGFWDQDSWEITNFQAAHSKLHRHHPQSLFHPLSPLSHIANVLSFTLNCFNNILLRIESQSIMTTKGFFRDLSSSNINIYETKVEMTSGLESFRRARGVSKHTAERLADPTVENHVEEERIWLDM